MLNAFNRVGCHGACIMGKKDTPFLARPGQNFRIRRARNYLDILHPHYIDVRFAAQQTRQNGIVEVFVQ